MKKALLALVGLLLITGLIYHVDKTDVPMTEYVVDLDADPFIPTLPKGWDWKEHRKGGQFKYNLAKVRLHLSVSKNKHRPMNWDDLRKETKGLRVANANLLDFYENNQSLIPEEWKGKVVFFWGTIYKSPDGLCVRYLSWNRGEWNSSYSWANDDFGLRSWAVVLRN